MFWERGGRREERGGGREVGWVWEWRGGGEGGSQTEIDRVVQEAEEYRDGDVANTAKIEATNCLKNYCVTVGNTAPEEQLKFKFGAGDWDKVNKEKIEVVEIVQVILQERVQQRTVEQDFRHARCGATPGGRVHRRHGSRCRKVPRQKALDMPVASEQREKTEHEGHRKEDLCQAPGSDR